MRRSADFAATIRGGKRRRSALAVVYAAKRREPEPVVGFVVSKAVGNSVTRHHVTRRLRAVMAGNMALVPAGTGVVVRALPGAARSTYAELEAQVSGSLARLVGEPR